MCLNSFVVGFILFVFSVSFVPAADAQKYAYPYGRESQGAVGAVGVDTLAAQAPADRSPDDIRTALDIKHGTNVTKLVFYVSGYKSFLQAVENARNDVQTGASPATPGSTSIVWKGIAAQVLSVAAEQGASSRTNTANASTFRGNAIGIARLIAGDDPFPYCAIYDFACVSPLARILGGSSFSVSFNTSQNSGAAASSGAPPTDNSQVLNASPNQISAWGVRYDFHVHKRPSDIAKNYGAQFTAAIRKLGDDYIDAVDGLLDKIPRDKLADWTAKYVTLLRSDQTGDRGAFIKALSDAVKELADLAQKADPQFKASSDKVVTNMSAYFVGRDKAVRDYVNTITYSLSYDNTRPANQPTQSSAKFIFSARTGSVQTSANGTIEWYDQILKSNVSRLRDAQFAVQFDHTFGKSTAQLSPTLSAGYYYQYMVDNALLTLPSTALVPGTTIALPGNASVLLNTKGSINVGQVKVVFKIRNTGINIPLAVTFSDRTDLLANDNEVRGNFGISYNLDSLFSK
jgi:hypothetical protein